jgi:hypothetical protein
MEQWAGEIALLLLTEFEALGVLEYRSTWGLFLTGSFVVD